jgi:hypothetical protein
MPKRECGKERTMTTILVSSWMLLAGFGGLPAWDFSDAAQAQQWTANSFLTDVAVKEGALHARATSWDPFFSNRQVSFEATPWQYVVVKIKADQTGELELFWSGTVDGQYAGLSQEKSTRVTLVGDGAWHEVVFFPFWQGEGTIKQLRFDQYDHATYDIAWMKVMAWGEDQPPLTSGEAWDFTTNPDAWRVYPTASDRFAPPLDLPVRDKGWVNVELSAQKDTEGAVLWAEAKKNGLSSESFTIRGDGKAHWYNVEVQSFPTWGERLAVFGLRLPQEAGISLASVKIAEFPEGPPAMQVKYFGFENGVNRATRRASVLALLENAGGQAGRVTSLTLAVPEGVRVVNGPNPATVASLEHGEVTEVRWEVEAGKSGAYDVALHMEGEGAADPATASLAFGEALPIQRAEYVPQPHPVATDIDLCMYYFPGWAHDAAWDCIRRTAPNRKPLLGYYDEARVDNVDWQIKWAVENGIKCFLVDWYWCQGNQSLTHWFEAYRKAKYRDLLQVAVMWANHNPAGTNSRADWRKVTQEWIDRYFSLPAYYRLNGKPAIFLWAPDLLRADLGGSAEVKAALDESQAMARAAGYPGIAFVTVNNDESPSRVQQLSEEGFEGATNYHEFAKAVEMAPAPQRARYADLVATTPEVWKNRDAMSDKLTYYPLVETGWDSRPWHGSKSLLFSGRTAGLFEQLLRDAKTFSEAHGKRMLVLGPANEWGEGSYVEPATEYGFDMYEAIRRVFGKGDPALWPVNVGPADLGLPTYEFPPVTPQTAWSFAEGLGGWGPMMGVSPLECKDGALCFRTTSEDPAIRVPINGLQAERYPKATIRMRVTGPLRPGEAAELFWSVGGGAMTEATAITFPLIQDGAFHDYAVDLSTRPRWRGRISTLRFDPCNARDAEVAIEKIVFEKAP